MWVFAAILAILAVIVVVVVVAVLAERFARARLDAEIVDRTRGVLGTAPVIGFDGDRPLLLQLARRRLSGVRVDTRDSAHVPYAILLDGRARDVAPVPSGIRVGALTATVTLRLSWLRHVVEAAQVGRDQAKDMIVRSVSLSSRRRSVVLTVGLPVAFGLGVDVKVVVAVGVDDGRLTFRATDLSMPVSVVPVPLPIAWAIDSWIKQLRPKLVPEAVDALTIDAMAWDADAVTLVVTAADQVVPLGEEPVADEG